MSQKHKLNKIKINKTLKVNEIFKSIQGESSKVGFPCIFIRLTYCNLRCSYCDTEYAFHDGEDMKIESILNQIKDYKTKLVQVTGGEPLLQKNSIILLNELVKLNYEVLLETSGSLPITNVPKKVKKVVDFKCPTSKMSKKNLWSIANDLSMHDEIKFVIGDINDYEWTKLKIKEHELNKKAPILFSPVYDKISLKKLADWILRDNLDVRLQMQMHKYIWSPDKRGV